MASPEEKRPAPEARRPGASGPPAAARRAGIAYLLAVGKLFLLFTILPILDLWLLLRIGGAIGFWPAVALVIGTGLAGAWLARAEGFRVLRSWQTSLAAGRAPEEGVLSGVLVLVGAALLVTPGVITDALGLALLFPPTRRIVAAALRRRLAAQVAAGHVRVMRFGGPPPARTPGEGVVVDVTPRRDSLPE
jgi:UPF0716 protein FxsA